MLEKKTEAFYTTCFHRFQLSIWHGMACSFMGHHAKEQYKWANKLIYRNVVGLSEVQMNGSTEEWLKTTVGVKQGCLLTSILFHVCLSTIANHRVLNKKIYLEDEGALKLGRQDAEWQINCSDKGFWWIGLYQWHDKVSTSPETK